MWEESWILTRSTSETEESGKSVLARHDRLVELNLLLL